MLRIGTILAVARDRAVDKPRVFSRQDFVVQAETLHDPGPESFHHDIGVARELEEDALAFLRLEI